MVCGVMCRVCRCGGSTGSAVQSFTGTFLAECLPAPQQEWLERCLQPSRQGAGEREAQLAALNSRIEGHKQVVTKALARKRLLHKFADSPMDAVKSALSLQSRCLEVTYWPGCWEWGGENAARCSWRANWRLPQCRDALLSLRFPFSTLVGASL